MRIEMDILGVGLPRMAAPLLSRSLWRMPTRERVVYLTFDDGPSCSYSRGLSAFLASRGCRATFFMTGKQIENHPEIAAQLGTDGHATGLHGYRHLDGWTTPENELLEDFEQAMRAFRSVQPDARLLFRPPYGRLRRSLNRAVEQVRGTVVMWDLLAGDYHPDAQPDIVSRRIIRYVRPGSIVVLHDGPESGQHAMAVTRQIVDDLLRQGWRFLPIEPVDHAS